MSTVFERWQAAEWRLIAEHAAQPAKHLALDEALLEAVKAGARGPTLRFWAWSSPAVILGRFQSLSNEVDLAAADSMGVTVVRRISGGGAMFVQPDSTITYSLYVPEAMLEGMSIRDSYEFCDSWVVAVFRELGIDAWYAPLNDITSPEGKIGGAAQARRPGVVLHHTTIAYEMNPDEMLKLIRIGREKLTDKGIPSAAKRVSPLRRQTELPRMAIVDFLVEGFRRRFGVQVDDVTADEWEAAKRLLSERYATQEWLRELE